jgi:hypothetical protein
VQVGAMLKQCDCDVYYPLLYHVRNDMIALKISDIEACSASTQSRTFSYVQPKKRNMPAKTIVYYAIAMHPVPERHALSIIDHISPDVLT